MAGVLSLSCRSNRCAVIRGTGLFRQLLPIGLSPSAIFGHGLHMRATLGAAGAWTLGLGLGHAGAGLCFKAGAHVDDLALDLRLVRRLILRLIPSATSCRDEGQREQQASLATVVFILPFAIFVMVVLTVSTSTGERVIPKMAARNIHLTDFSYGHYHFSAMKTVPFGISPVLRDQQEGCEVPVQAGVWRLSQSDCGWERARGTTGAIHSSAGAGTGNFSNAGLECIRATLGGRLF